MAVRRRGTSAVAVHGGGGRVPKRARVTAEPSLLDVRAFRAGGGERARGGGGRSRRRRRRRSGPR